jgi:hypothetical protein
MKIHASGSDDRRRRTNRLSARALFGALAQVPQALRQCGVQVHQSVHEIPVSRIRPTERVVFSRVVKFEPDEPVSAFVLQEVWPLPRSLLRPYDEDTTRIGVAAANLFSKPVNLIAAPMRIQKLVRHHDDQHAALADFAFELWRQVQRGVDLVVHPNVRSAEFFANLADLLTEFRDQPLCPVAMRVADENVRIEVWRKMGHQQTRSPKAPAPGLGSVAPEIFRFCAVCRLRKSNAGAMSRPKTLRYDHVVEQIPKKPSRRPSKE